MCINSTFYESGRQTDVLFAIFRLSLKFCSCKSTNNEGTFGGLDVCDDSKRFFTHTTRLTLSELFI